MKNNQMINRSIMKLYQTAMEKFDLAFPSPNNLRKKAFDNIAPQQKFDSHYTPSL